VPDVYPNDECSVYYLRWRRRCSCKLSLLHATVFWWTMGYWCWYNLDIIFGEPSNNNQTGMPSAWCTDVGIRANRTMCWAHDRNCLDDEFQFNSLPTHPLSRTCTTKNILWVYLHIISTVVLLDRLIFCNRKNEAVVKPDPQSHRVKSQWLEILSTPKSIPPSSVESLSSGDN